MSDQINYLFNVKPSHLQHGVHLSRIESYFLPCFMKVKRPFVMQC